MDDPGIHDEVAILGPPAWFSFFFLRCDRNSLGEFDIGYFRLRKSLKISIPILADPPVLDFSQLHLLNS